MTRSARRRRVREQITDTLEKARGHVAKRNPLKTLPFPTPQQKKGVTLGKYSQIWPGGQFKSSLG